MQAKKHSSDEAQRIQDIQQYINGVLPLKFGAIDMYQNMAAASPALLDGYMRMRACVLRNDPDAPLPKWFMELALVSGDIVEANSWGAQMHIRQAVRDGVTVPQVVEAVAINMVEGGVKMYKPVGLEVIVAAEKEAAKLADAHRGKREKAG